MTRVAVIAHRKKTLGGGLGELRRRLTDEGIKDPIWYEVPKSRKAPKKVRKALDKGAELILVWGGDGMVQHCVDTLAGWDGATGILPAGTANLLATNLGIPQDLDEALRIALHGERRRIDLGRVNGQHFAVMAGAGFDAEMISDADRQMKDSMGKLAYVWTGLRHVRDEVVPVKIKVDGEKWFDGEASCVLFGNVSTITGGIEAFDDARPDDGRLEIGVATGHGVIDWARTLGRMAVGRSENSPLIEITQGRKVDVRFGKPQTYEVDGGACGTDKRLKVRVVPSAITVCVPAQREGDQATEG
ncbi:diacylglycerol/lipid kinase family protein [Micromonospora sp. NBC_01796]|uniref:diacylglycerol/lipid kinase family protein n=1 Tax=Micromonospora sp. NBC_01796 TaxID=2975987 RepID=UPI002DD91A47|nr:YegS/Rv2252/BmrU family lipid kinase [Micromonospora sp. NBC_01796]WSA86949.1 YegS/Rv2252/BmrU family lipid kinase [Micromonospora sp. NBC_01796]